MSASVKSPAVRALLPGDVSPETSAPTLTADIDASCRAPVLFFFVSGLAWLLIGTIFALISAYKMHSPDFLGNCEWLTFGRVRPAHLTTVVYGFAMETSIAVLIWLMCRLCRTPLIAPGIITIANFFWNLGLTVGVVGILAGDSTGIEWLEMPKYSTPILFISYALIAVWAIITFRLRAEKHLYVSQWYLLAAVLWFPWLYGTAQVMLLLSPVRGVVQAGVNWWFAHNVLGLWFTPVGLAAIYYFIPKVIGRPIHSYYLSVLGFWTLALFYNWNGFHHLVGGPLPAWMITVSIVASIMMLIPVTAVAINHHFTMVGHFGKMRYSPTLRFIVFGAMSYTVASVQGSLSALRSVSEVTHFTHHTIAHAHVGMYAFFTMVMFGSMYYILPRVTQREWPSARLISLHFWGSALGIILYVVPLSYGGILQGQALNDASIPFLKVVALTLPYLKIRTFAGVILALGHVAFAVNIVWMLVRVFGPYRKPLQMIISGSEQPAAVGK
ncbi:MAG TPA: cbb3-type cytochrome c oxidase subunit I [Candidatus Limnocylindria bacterium]|jgi:cytochrome c oxidase cbb3-type subunit 1|nr:cbb3-type cytochrome c oxidase subunit I [Candidatus Limnocylindria bacterium]